MHRGRYVPGYGPCGPPRGLSEIGEYWRRAALEEAEHAAKFAELLGEVLTDSTKKNLEMRVDAENGATLGKFELAKKAKELNLDAIHDTVHEMARDEARHGKGFRGSAEALLCLIKPDKEALFERERGNRFPLFCVLRCPVGVPLPSLSI